MEPYRLRRWRMGTSAGPIHFFTCARPGRSKGRGQAVPDKLVDQWVHGLPGTKTAIISLLGRKKDGLSEFSFYSFYGGLDTPPERGKRPSFQQWLAQRHKEREIVVREHPTTDYQKIPPDTIDAVKRSILDLVSAGYTVVVVDSGGEQRTGQVCTHIGAVEDSRTN